MEGSDQEDCKDETEVSTFGKVGINSGALEVSHTPGTDLYGRWHHAASWSQTQ